MNKELIIAKYERETDWLNQIERLEAYIFHPHIK